MFQKCLLVWALFLPAIIARSPLIPYDVTEEADICNSCKGAVKLVENVLSDISLDAMVSFTESEVCPEFGSKQCHQVTGHLLPLMAHWFKTTSTPAHLCSAPQVCGSRLSSSHLHTKTLERLPQDGPTCAMCAFVLDRLKAALDKPDVQKTILETVLQACNTLPTQLASSCSDFVTTYEPQLMQYINHMQSSQICMLLGVCMAGLASSTQPPPPLPLALVKPLAAVHDRLAEAEAAAPANSACDICQMSVIEAHALVTNPSIQSTLVNYTKDLCGAFGGPFTAACEDYVDVYAPLVFDLLDKYLSAPDQLCAQVGLCKARTLFDIWQQQLKHLAAKLGAGLAVRADQ